MKLWQIYGLALWCCTGQIFGPVLGVRDCTLLGLYVGMQLQSENGFLEELDDYKTLGFIG